MKSKKIIILILLLTGILVFNSTSQSILTSKEKKEKENNGIELFYSGEIVVNKLGEDNNFLPGVTFKLKSYNNQFEWNLNSDDSETGDSFYYLGMPEQIKIISGLDKVLSPTQYQLVSSLKTVGDVLEKTKIHIGPYPADEEYPDIFEMHIILPTIFTLEETIAPTGYVKDKVFLPGQISLYYRITSMDETNENNVPIELLGTEIYLINDSSYLPYNDYNEEDILGIDGEKSHEFWKNNATISINECFDQPENTIADPPPQVAELPWTAKRIELRKYGVQETTEGPGTIPGDFAGPDCYITLKNVKGQVSLKVENKVNETNSLTTTNDTNLAYKVILKNTGNVDAIDNTLTSRIPEGFEYIEGSASDGGVYSNGEITWDVKRLEKNEERTFTFRVHVPKGTDLSKDYIGESSVTNSSIENRIESEKTVVKLSLINPNTIAPIVIISVVLISLVLLLIQVLKHKNKQTVNQV